MQKGKNVLHISAHTVLKGLHLILSEHATVKRIVKTCVIIQFTGFNRRLFFYDFEIFPHFKLLISFPTIKTKEIKKEKLQNGEE